MLHPYQESKIPDISDIKALAQVTIEISNVLKTIEGISFCFPWSAGVSMPRDYGKIVYFPEIVI